MNILKDKVIVVVGASSGIGAAISEYFCNHGAITCIFGRRKERLEKLCDRAKEKNQRMYPYTGDARNYSNLARMAEQIVGCFGKIDVWNKLLRYTVMYLSYYLNFINQIECI